MRASSICFLLLFTATKTKNSISGAEPVYQSEAPEITIGFWQFFSVSQTLPLCVILSTYGSFCYFPVP